MSAHCHHHHEPAPGAVPPGYRRVLWIALAVNAAMFLLEIGSGLASGSVALMADAIDFLGDAANYALSLGALALGMAWRSRVALLKAASMLVFGVGVLLLAAWRALAGTTPEPMTMGVVGVIALAANVGVALLLYRFREGDADMRSVWLCTRNDAIGNLAVLAAAVGVFGSGSRWPDLAVAAVMGSLALVSGWSVWRQAGGELAHSH